MTFFLKLEGILSSWSSCMANIFSLLYTFFEECVSTVMWQREECSYSFVYGVIAAVDASSPLFIGRTF